MFYPLFTVLREHTDTAGLTRYYQLKSWHGVETYEDEGALNDAVQELLEEIMGLEDSAE